jgi:hypothetical protein
MSTKEWTRTLAASLRARWAPSPQFDALLQAACDASGYRRLSAVHALDQMATPATLPALIIRVNDWVEPVRRTALSAITKLALPANAAAFATCLPLFHQLSQRSRADHAPLIQFVEDFLCEPANAAAVVSAITDPQPRIARACLKLAITRGLADAATLVAQGMKQRDLATRTMTAPLIAQLRGKARDKVLAVALADRNMPLRLAALRILLAQAPDSVDVKAYLFDRHLAIRLLAAGHRRTQGGNPASIYAEELARGGKDPVRLRIALWGLGEHGTRSDATTIRPFLHHSVPSVRCEALHAYARRDGEDLHNIVLHALGSTDAAVSNEAGRIARRAHLQFDATQLLPLLLDPPRANVAATLVAAQQLSNKWERLILLLHLRRVSGDEGHGNFVSAIRHWEDGYNRNFMPVTAKQRNTLMALLQRASARPLQDCGDAQRIEQLRWMVSQ